ncbi:nicotinate-nucleotide--dimethylbenzimidazole phosphoribosyltransferase [Vitiosangium sp. GDMCC 1.1324]|uniref:nicotinate-nucleotide--dimethylbenzimidazole phosphoribosyltransferase n=1 Tax=Vitiosangium sp. (strain GDMCC 1.1324) TaxID=2138576 RepID=UPI000D382661|nr:nicotinate-nucleotide--dimethylbenzimidazole phosphoribosyltransferase [Vitiosangium sp. GDMCC 1.1324]PTL85646.1 nicotinate-nucleotide--dimethylbenzimidazole phosphoribosyltransferase [Vitiosangium sp. GDMCC 1.1324]
MTAEVETQRGRWVIPELDTAAAERARQRQSRLTKPPGSLGVLEEVAVKLAAWQGTPLPRSRPAAALLFAADHAVTRHGVSPYPSAVTAAMVENFLRGGAASSVLCRQLGVPLHVVDVGVMRPPAHPPAEGVFFRRDPVADEPGGDLRVEDAMSEATFRRALEAGAAEVDTLPDDVRLVVLGEMGIGNTTAAAAVAAVLLGRAAEDVVGRGTGVDDAGLARKVAVVRDAVQRLGGASPQRAVQSAGGRDIAALVGAAARAIERRKGVLVDGFIVSVAMLALERMVPGAREWMLFSHRSAESGHRHVLEALGARPMLDLGLRLGEGSGALTALPLVDAACALHTGMATFEEAGVPDQG